MRLLTLLSLLALLGTACKEKDLSIDNPAPPQENVEIRASFIYPGQYIHPDSAIVNNQGFTFFIDDIELVISDFYFREGKDTVLIDSFPVLFTDKQTDKAITNMEKGGYSGHFALTAGLDSGKSVRWNRADLPEDNDLRDSDHFRADNKGIDHLVIRGRLIDPFDPLDSTGTIPLHYRIGTGRASRHFQSNVKNFSLDKNGKVILIMEVDLKPILHDFDLEARPQVKTDPRDLVDYSLGLEMADSLRIGLF